MDLKEHRHFRVIVQFADLAKLPIITPCQRHGIRRLVDSAFERHHQKLKPVLEVNGASTIFAMVHAGLGYALMPSSGTQPWVDRGDLKVLPIRPAIRRTISLIVRSELLNERPVAALRSLVTSVAPRFASKRSVGSAAICKEPPMPERHRKATDMALESRQGHL